MVISPFCVGLGKRENSSATWIAVTVLSIFRFEILQPHPLFVLSLLNRKRKSTVSPSLNLPPCKKLPLRLLGEPTVYLSASASHRMPSLFPSTTAVSPVPNISFSS